MPFFNNNDIDIYYIKEGEGEPLVLISGLGSKTSWTFQIPYFKEKMMVIAPHNRGVGKSSRPNYPYTMETFIDDIRALLAHLKIEKKIHLCGISMGGMIAQNYVLKYPDTVKTLILCATAAKHDPTQVLESQRIMDKYDLDSRFKTRVGALYSRPFRRKLKRNNEIYEKLKKDFVEDPTRLQDWINQAASFSTHDTTDRLHLIKQPTLILVGDEDRIILPTEEYGTDFLHEHIPNSRLEIVNTTGHGFVSEEPEKVNNLIWNFIQEHISL